VTNIDKDIEMRSFDKEIEENKQMEFENREQKQKKHKKKKKLRDIEER